MTVSPTRRVFALVAVMALAMTAMAVTIASRATPVAAAAAGPTALTAKRTRAIPGGAFRESSPLITNLDGQPDIVLGSINHQVYAVHATDGGDVAGWPVATT